MRPQGNPYSPPSLAPEDREPIVPLGATVLKWSLSIGVVYGLAVGVGACVYCDSGLAHFGGLDYSPRVIGIGLVRQWGVAGAALVSAMTTVVLLHRAASRSAEPVAVDARLPIVIAASVLALYPIVVATGLLGAFPVWRVDSGGSVKAFAEAVRDGLVLADVGLGTVASAVDAVVIAVAMQIVSKWLLSRTWTLFPKILAAWAVLQGLAMARAAWATLL